MKDYSKIKELNESAYDFIVNKVLGKEEELSADAYFELSKISMIEGEKDTAIKYANTAIDINAKKIVINDSVVKSVFKGGYEDFNANMTIDGKEQYMYAIPMLQTDKSEVMAMMVVSCNKEQAIKTTNITFNKNLNSSITVGELFSSLNNSIDFNSFT